MQLMCSLRLLKWQVIKRILLASSALACIVACSGFGAPVGGMRRSGERVRTVWFLGDSLTEGQLETSPGIYVDSGGYRVQLYADFTTKEKVRYNFIGTQTDGPGAPTLPNGNNDGHAGWWTADLGNMLVSAGTGVQDVLSHVPTWMSTIGYPDIVVILIGANSVKHCYLNDSGTPGEPQVTYAVPAGATCGACWSGYIGANPSAGVVNAFEADYATAEQDTANEIVSVVDAVATGCNHTCREIVVNVLPQTGFVLTINAVNTKLAAALTSRTNVVYVTTPSITTADLGPDATHLTTTGYQKLGDAIYAAFPP